MNKKYIVLFVLLSFVVCCSGIKTYYVVEQNKFKSDMDQMKMDGFLNYESESVIEHKSILSGGNIIYYYTSGCQNNPAILFLHPAFSDHTCFYKQIDFFSQEFRVITIDLIGHGLSEVRNPKQKIDKSIEHIQEIMHVEGIYNFYSAPF